MSETITQEEFMAAAQHLADNLSVFDALAVTVLLNFMDQTLEGHKELVEQLRRQVTAANEDYARLEEGMRHRGSLLGQRSLRIKDLEDEVERLTQENARLRHPGPRSPNVF